MLRAPSEKTSIVTVRFYKPRVCENRLNIGFSFRKNIV